jgi:hypothetical protein
MQIHRIDNKIAVELEKEKQQFPGKTVFLSVKEFG